MDTKRNYSVLSGKKVNTYNIKKIGLQNSSHRGLPFHLKIGQYLGTDKPAMPKAVKYGVNVGSRRNSVSEIRPQNTPALPIWLLQAEQ